MKRLLLSLALLAALAILPVSSQAKKTESLKEINVSYVKSPFNLPSIVVKNRQMLEKAFEGKGIRVKYYEINSGAKQAEAMAAKSLDIAGVINTTSVILANANGNHVEIISGYSKPSKVFSLVVKDPGIRSVRDLKGKKIAGPKGTVLHQMLAARDKFAETYPEAARLFVETHIKALEWIRSNPAEAIMMGAEEQNISFEDAETLYNWTDFDFSFTQEERDSIMEDIVFLKNAGMIREEISPDIFISIINP